MKSILAMNVSIDGVYLSPGSTILILKISIMSGFLQCTPTFGGMCMLPQHRGGARFCTLGAM